MRPISTAGLRGFFRAITLGVLTGAVMTAASTFGSAPAGAAPVTVLAENWASCTSDASTLYPMSPNPPAMTGGGTVGIRTYVAPTSSLSCPGWTAAGQAWLVDVESNSNSGAPEAGSKAMYLNEGNKVNTMGTMERTLSGLTPGGYYEINVLAWKDAGNGATTLEVSVTSGSASTEYTMPFSASNSGPQTVQLQFPVETNSAVISLTGGILSDSSPIIGSVTVTSRPTAIFDANGGEGTMASQTAAEPAALNANAFTKPDCSFAGWNTAANGTGTPYADEAEYAFDEDVTLYAQWVGCPAPPTPLTPTTPTWTITLEPNGGACTVASISGASGTWVNLPGPSECSRAGYELTSWNDSASGSSTGFAPGKPTQLTGDNELFAIWTPTATPSPMEPSSNGPSPQAAPEKPTAQMRKAHATVLFAASSAALTAEGKATLRNLVRKTGDDAVTVVSVGFVQKSGSSSNDQSLSTARAKAVGAFLRGQGVKGAYTVRGDGVGGPGAKDRKVVVTVTYRR